MEHVDAEYEREFRRAQVKEDRRHAQLAPMTLICAACGADKCICSELNRLGHLDI